MDIPVRCVSTAWVGNATYTECTFDSVREFLDYCKQVWGEAPALTASADGKDWFDKVSGERVLVRA